MANILLIDDHEIVRTGIKIVLNDLYSPDIICEASDEKSAMQILSEMHFDLVIMDIDMPDSNALRMVEFLKKVHPLTKVLIFSMGTETLYAKRFFKAGARGFVSKNSGLLELSKAIDRVLNNTHYISETFTQILAEDILLGDDDKSIGKLSKQEFTIAALIMKGKKIAEIAEELKLSKSTAGTYKARVYTKLGVKNIAELIEIGKMNKLL